VEEANIVDSAQTAQPVAPDRQPATEAGATKFEVRQQLPRPFERGQKHTPQFPPQQDQRTNSS
jgi:hypothetical protein